jgi:hypothetical protein
MVDPERLELPTPAFEAQCSIQLSYGSALIRTSVADLEEYSHGNTVNMLLKSFSFAASRIKGFTPKISSMVRSVEPWV